MEQGKQVEEEEEEVEEDEEEIHNCNAVYRGNAIKLYSW